MGMPSLAARLIKSTVEVPVILRGISIVHVLQNKMKSEFDSRPRLAARAFINEKFSMHALLKAKRYARGTGTAGPWTRYRVSTQDLACLFRYRILTGVLSAPTTPNEELQSIPGRGSTTSISYSRNMYAITRGISSMARE